MRLASLPMYALPGLTNATAAWWAGLAVHFERAGLGEVPATLTAPRDLLAHWTDSDLLFSQTCGYPLTHVLDGQVTLVATPCYAAPGCTGPTYRSQIVVSSDNEATTIEDLRARRCAVNDPTSQSGYNALRAMIAPLARGEPFFSSVQISGSHGASLALVAAGAADVAAIDCVTHALVTKHAPELLSGTRVLCQSSAAPALPYICAGALSARDLGRLRLGLRAALDDPDLAATRAALLLQDIAVLPPEAYDVIPAMEHDAVALGYPAIA